MKKLLEKEKEQLINQGCVAEDWDKVHIENSDLNRINHISFLMNVSINGSVFIRNVGSLIANYSIEEGVIIENIGALYTEGETSFGNGVRVSPVTEGGGRSIRIYDTLSAHTAYIGVFYRQNQLILEKLEILVEKYCLSRMSSQGKIEKNARISNTRSIKNTNIGSHAIIENADEIREVSILSSVDSPTYIGSSVILKDCIISRGAYLAEGVIVTKSFIGEGVKLTKQFSCDESLLFANCEGQHGEACSIFAGPYTVTHHKSTLLIAGYFSFYNAGSGTNQSNHMYKLGPNHQGVLERGCKTASDSYLGLPCHIGAFSTVIGSHCNLDSSDFPFSRVKEMSRGKSEIMPAINLFGVGVSRDDFKWKNRDRRKGEVQDFIIFSVLNPYTVSRMMRAERILRDLKEKEKLEENLQDFTQYKNMYIRSSRLFEYSSYYSRAIDFYLCDILFSHLFHFPSLKDFKNPKKGNSQESWLDLAGLILPKEKVNGLIEELINGEISSIQILGDKWKEFYGNYEVYEREWVFSVLEKRLSLPLEKLQKSDLQNLAQEYDVILKDILAIFEKDLQKEFNRQSRVSFGLDWEEDRDLDFESVRGNVLDNAFFFNLRNP